MKQVLLTGFEPFDGESTNVSIEVANRLARWSGANCNISVREMPTVFDESIVCLKRGMRDVQPDVVICLGQGWDRSTVSVERVALNLNDARIPDNRGNQPVDTRTVVKGPAAYWSTLPVKAIVQALVQHDIPASISETAGTFVCNHLFYGLMHELRRKGSVWRKKGTVGGLIHLPCFPEQTTGHSGRNTLSLELMVKAVQLAIEATVEERE